MKKGIKAIVKFVEEHPTTSNLVSTTALSSVAVAVMLKMYRDFLDKIEAETA